MQEYPDNRADADPDRPDSREIDSLTAIIRMLQDLSPPGQKRVLASVLTFFGNPSFGEVRSPHPQSQLGRPTPNNSNDAARFSEDRAPSAKEFLFSKRPQTEVDRIACLAYYLAHYRNTPHFKTLDLSKLNTEAAQLKMSNPTMAVDNATKSGLLVQASKGAKQLSALGELYVQALPDREAARSAISAARPKRRRKGGKSSASQSGEEE